MDPRPENQKLFDWKRSGAYAWKSAFPLTRTGERLTRPIAPPPAPAEPQVLNTGEAPTT